jgi:hypothetical protein
MDGRLREATSVEIMTAIGKLFRALPPRKAKPEELLESYEIACHKATKHAIETVVIKLIRGELDGLSKSFAPSPAELSAAIRDEMAWVQKKIDLAVERVAIDDNRPTAVHKPLLWERQKIERQRMADEGRMLLFTVDNIDQLRARRADLPKDFGYIAITGEVWGPPGSGSASDQVPAMADGDLPW